MKPGYKNSLVIVCFFCCNRTVLIIVLKTVDNFNPNERFEFNVPSLAEMLHSLLELISPPPYFHNLTSLINNPPKAFGKVPQWLWEGSPMGLGGVPKGFGKPCVQATEVCMASSRSYDNEGCKSPTMPHARRNHAS